MCISLDVAYFYMYPNVYWEAVKYHKVCVKYALDSGVLHWPVHHIEAEMCCTQ